MRLVWTTNAWEDYLYWQGNDKKTLRRVNQLLRDTLRDPFEGIGKPEPLKYGAEGAWSRRITQEHRLVYTVAGTDLVILQARYHY
ncbi:MULTISPECIES: Txe/YoeB family addiction module toxin [Corynebacterium]|uniref:Endoribonuclease YoeB n=1 Tax=Corynebacterium coyleae TaxID=53374 RepID=A0ABX8KXR0_9CORY|nr:MULTISPECIES: Txe/YoeB family addiction module toxin [Corynebacterium]MDK8662861.1 Txe/YoeB family addiction module toxin [Corynebacterium coyleae]MDK8706093.1 Txe/YoeB family addiction module toxin [Corynebacterium coyleae]MDK8732820.1 Txe/YoeB family addiction module toxin [Corynebacterium coyleae]MDK8798599.1 Txe/YoeB family addiction module toxin [Corynebacterium coyleae]MDK8822428.1 Txe/YoeB family addiction module toxin [Corynebacterium coyleae]